MRSGLFTFDPISYDSDGNRIVTSMRHAENVVVTFNDDPRHCLHYEHAPLMDFLDHNKHRLPRTLHRSDLTNIAFNNVVIVDRCFAHCNFENSTFVNSVINRCSFIQCNFNGCRFEGCSITEVDMTLSHLETTDFGSHSILKDLHLDNSYITKETKINIPMVCPEDGGFIAWKKAKRILQPYGDAPDNARSVLVKLYIPASAKRSSSTSSKCRCSEAKVLGIYDLSGNDISKVVPAVRSSYDPDFEYRVGTYVFIPNFDENRWSECSNGIHFFMDKDTARRYQF